jgi:hypothetical protein
VGPTLYGLMRNIDVRHDIEAAAWVRPGACVAAEPDRTRHHGGTVSSNPACSSGESRKPVVPQRRGDQAMCRFDRLSARRGERDSFSAGGDIHEQREDDRRFTEEELQAHRPPRRSSYEISGSISISDHS